MRDMTQAECLMVNRMAVCPHCGKWEYMSGPRGGECMNIMCAFCGMRLNILEPFGKFLAGEVIEEPEGYEQPPPFTIHLIKEYRFLEVIPRFRWFGWLRKPLPKSEVVKDTPVHEVIVHNPNEKLGLGARAQDFIVLVDGWKVKSFQPEKTTTTVTTNNGETFKLCVGFKQLAHMAGCMTGNEFWGSVAKATGTKPIYHDPTE